MSSSSASTGTLPGSRLLLWATMLAAALMLLATAWLGDDAFITLRVIDNFVNGYGLRYNVIERVQVATHPLWLLLLTPFYAVTREALVTTMLVSVIVALGALWVLAARIAADLAWGCLLALLAVMSCAIYQYSTSGLENPLTFLLLALFVWQISNREKPWVPAAFAGLLLLNRLDLAVLVGPATAWLLFRARGRRRVQVALALLLPALAWMAFSLVYYGAPLPNTAYAKLGTGYSTAMRAMQGIEYAKDFALADPLLVVLMALAAFQALRSRDVPAMLLGSGMLLYIAYTILAGGDYMSGRFFATPGFLALCILGRAQPPQWWPNGHGACATPNDGNYSRHDRSPSLPSPGGRGGEASLREFHIKARKLIGLVAIASFVALLASRAVPQEREALTSNGIIDERRNNYPLTGLLPTLKKRWAGDVVALPRERHAGKLVTREEGTAGMPGYYSGPNVHIVEYFAITDAFLARLPAFPGSRVGHYKREMPAGYLESVLDAAPRTGFDELRPLLSDITMATRAPLLADGRWPAIWRLLSGQHDWTRDSYSFGAAIYHEVSRGQYKKAEETANDMPHAQARTIALKLTQAVSAIHAPEQPGQRQETMKLLKELEALLDQPITTQNK